MTALSRTINKFPHTFWVANTLELFERWAYYGMFTVISVYLTNPVSEGGLGFTQSQRGLMQALATGLLYLIPILGGAIADRFGYRKVLLSAFVTLASGYFAMGYFSSYGAVFAAFLLVAIGGALFKPIIVATVSKTTTKETDTLGFGIFYMIVNIGGFIGPFIASKLRDISWNYVFIMCMMVILFNIILLYFYKEPHRNIHEKGEGLGKAISLLIKNAATVLKDTKFVIFLVIMVGMWTLYMQLFFTLPIYITQWIDTTDVYKLLPDFLAPFIGVTVNGKDIIRPEMMINVPALCIILFQVFVSNKLGRVRPVSSISFGIAVIAIGLGQMGFHSMGIFVLMGTVVLAFGEMASSPRIQEYIGRIAPKEKVALYMGYSFLPVAGGNVLGGLLSGSLYGSMSDKYVFLKDYLVREGYEKLDRIAHIDGGVLYNNSLERLHLSSNELDQLLQAQYHPGNIWFIFAAIGFVTSLLLFVYDRFILKSS